MAESTWDGVNRREYDRQLAAIDKKLDAHSSILEEVKATLQQIAVQNVQIQSLQAMQNEMRGDITLNTERIQKLITDFSACKSDIRAYKHSITVLWGILSTALLGIIGAYISHMVGGIK